MPTSPARSRTTRADLTARSLGHLRRIIHAIHTRSAGIEAATGLTGPQLWALSEVVRAPEGVTLSELARRLALHKANAGRLVDRLVTKRLVRRETPPSDRRVVVVHATAAGRRRAHAAGQGPPQARLLSELEGLGRAELAGIEKALARLVALLGAEEVEGAPLFDQAGRAGRPPARREARRA
jgi:MarR family transcriptional regulator for hemolysin